MTRMTTRHTITIMTTTMIMAIITMMSIASTSIITAIPMLMTTNKPARSQRGGCRLPAAERLASAPMRPRRCTG